MGNIALNKLATASSYVKPYTAANAVNGATTPFSRWLCSTVPCWMCVDTGSMYLVNRWVIKHMPLAGWRSPDYANSDFKLQGSIDNVNWYDIDVVTNNSASTTDRTLPNPVAFRFFRTYYTKGLRCNTQMSSIMEFELYQAYSNQLTGLAVSAGTLTPTFSSTVYAYTNTVGPDVASINITPTAKDPQAVIKINNQVSPSGQPKAVSLNFGVNNIVVNVTAGDGSQNNYTIAVTRQGNADLKSLQALSNGLVNVSLNPSFDKGVTAYTAKIDYDDTEICYIPTTDDPLATIKLDGTSTPNGSISGATVVGTGITSSLEVTSTYGNKKTYSVAVSKNTSAYLTSFQVKVGTAYPDFSPAPFTRKNLGDYSLTVTGSVTGVVITITTEDPLATAVVTSNGTVLTKGTSGYSLRFAGSGLYAVIVQVTSTSGDVKSYKLNITKN